MKPIRASILSTTEEKFLLNQIAVLRKIQIKSLPDDKILHDFLSCVSSEKTLVAYKDVDSGNQISWNASKGFILNLEDSFFESPEKLQTAYEAVRNCFFENFLDESDLAELGSEASTPSSGKNLEDESDSVSEMSPDSDTLEVDSDDELDLLSKVNDLDANTLSSDEIEIETDEFSNFSAQESSELSTNETQEILNENTGNIDDSDDSQIVPEEQNTEDTEIDEQAETATSESDESLEDSSENTTEEESQSSDTTDEEPENPASDEEIDNETSEDNDKEHSDEVVESEPSAVAETEEQQDAESTDSESGSASENNDTEGPDFDDLAKQLADVGMETDKIDSLLSAVKSGKAPLETVQATIEKLKSASE